jgi:hypothetical protein
VKTSLSNKPISGEHHAVITQSLSDLSQKRISRNATQASTKRWRTLAPSTVKGTQTMAGHSRKTCLEMLEGRQLMSHTVALVAADVSVLAKRKPKTISVVGTIVGTYSTSLGTSFSSTVDNYDGAGNLPVLGLIQMTTTVPTSGRPTQHGTMTLTSGAGTLTLAVVVQRKGPIKLMVQNGTNAYAGWSGSGTVQVMLTESGYRHSFTDENAFKLKLRT